ncbi:MAG: hypothetical protein DMD81_18385 [Candidatus Rokuibacteriota bacterium]|nr:MAG: hypothetical protein DMD81_18385 [Candidatus Rokubacteria bacterium]
MEGNTSVRAAAGAGEVAVITRGAGVEVLKIIAIAATAHTSTIPPSVILKPRRPVRGSSRMIGRPIEARGMGARRLMEVSAS